MIGCLFAQPGAEKFSPAEAVGTPPGDAALAAEALEVAHQQQPEVDAGRNTGPAQAVVIIRLAEPFDELVEAGFSQQLVELAIEDMPCGSRQLVHRNPKGGLPFLVAVSQRHRRSSSMRPRGRLSKTTTAPQQASTPTAGHNLAPGRCLGKSTPKTSFTGC